MNTSTALSTRILVVDDEPDLRTLYELTLLREGYQVLTAGSVEEAQQALREQGFDLLITDMRLPDGLGLSLVQGIAQQGRTERSIVITAYGSAENAVDSLKAGAFDYLTKPVDLRQLRSVVAAALQSAPRTTPTAPVASRPSAVPPAWTDAVRQLTGSSGVMQAVRERILRVAGSNAPVLVQGESGTGKELVARALHACSHRSAQPFVAVNCGAIPESLLEAEFFGSRKGSYTGATHDREGFFQAAQGGTLFLDEIGDLPLVMQSKLLRAIQERSVRPLGATQEVAVDVRIISATHKDLAAEVQAQTFRQDLYYRLNVIDIAVPALRERREDLPELCDALLARIGQEAGLPPPALSSQFLEQLAGLPLRGNVRELENLLYRAMALGECHEVPTDFAPTMASALELPIDPPGDSPRPADAAADDLPGDLQSYLNNIERTVLMRALQTHGYNRSAVAASLGLNARQVRYRMARLNIQPPKGSEADAHD